MQRLTVTELNRQIKILLETNLPSLIVMGEVSNLSRPASGHLYFTLKDANAQIRCCFFKNKHSPGLGETLQNGKKLELRGKLSLYEARGDYQIIVDSVTDAGHGELHRQFERLKQKLKSDGLFEDHLKKAIPRFPQQIGIITSSTGAAIRDVLTTLSRRYPVATVKLYPCEVQGAHSANAIHHALTCAIRDAQCDVLLLTRGGGSIEDLWGFNDERVALAVAHSPIPIISGVGHETDFTIVDFVADYRAATPTAAAEKATPNAEELLTWLNVSSERLLYAIAKYMQKQMAQLQYLAQKIHSPEHIIHKQWQNLDHLSFKLQQLLRNNLHIKSHQHSQLASSLRRLNPLVTIKTQQQAINHLEKKLKQILAALVDNLKHQLAKNSTTLHAVSPLATLDRGYAIATKRNKVLTSTEKIKQGDKVQVQLAQGSIECTVDKLSQQSLTTSFKE